MVTKALNPLAEILSGEDEKFDKDMEKLLEHAHKLVNSGGQKGDVFDMQRLVYAALGELNEQIAEAGDEDGEEDDDV